MGGMRLIRPADRVEGQPTIGMQREEAIATEGMWSGFVTAEPGTVSGWHHHGEFESVIYILKGAFRMEFGPGGAEDFVAEVGDFIFVPKHEIHREGNPSDERGEFIVTRAGRGDAVINVDGPSEA
jgi:uncharacterized RmlC-like cupin family protein